MAGMMSAQEVTDTIRTLIAHVAQLSGALDTANKKIDALQQTCDGAWSVSYTHLTLPTKA